MNDHTCVEYVISKMCPCCVCVIFVFLPSFVNRYMWDFQSHPEALLTGVPEFRHEWVR